MKYVQRILFVFFIAILPGVMPAGAQAPSSAASGLPLSPPLMELLRAEMQAILAGVQLLAAAIPVGDWKGVADTSARIGASYILDQKMTPVQRKELETSLPEHFRMLDSGFHLESRKLEAAALNHDAQLVAFHFYRMMETCTACHSVYATGKFPGFAVVDHQEHHH